MGNDKEVSCEVWRGPDYSKNAKGYRLETIKVSKSFGGLKALNSVDLLVKPGQIHCLIGPNGSGKTTLINLLTGFYSPDEGEIRLNNERIDKLSPHNIVQLGIARTFQGAIICEGMTTLDNVRVAQHCTTISGIVRSGFASNYARQEEEKYKQRAYGLLKYIGLETKAFEPAENLGDGERRNLEIARALASNPRVLILDEPLAGLMEQEIRTVMEILVHLRNQGLAIVLIEHHIEAVLAISDVISVLNFGVKIAEGSPSEIVANEDVITAYLGRKK